MKIILRLHRSELIVANGTWLWLSVATRRVNYSRCWLQFTKHKQNTNKKLKHKIMANLDYLDTLREDKITCPYCGWKDSDSWEMTESGEVECGKCENEFYVEREIDVSYTSRKIE
jgi:DNA-directed RNA polymerase subunit RPC12/RpoP